MRNSFINTLVKQIDKGADLYLLTADLGYGLFDEIRDKYPERFINVGVAEQNMVSIAAGMALDGKMVFCYSMIPFLLMRAFEQIRVDVCNHFLNVRFIGVGCGYGYGLEGMTHHAIEDLAIMRSLPNMTVLAPGDPYECEQAIISSITHQGPVYIRLGQKGDPVIHQGTPEFKIGKSIALNRDKTSEIALISTGLTLSLAKLICEKLSKENDIQISLFSMPTVRPLDTDLLDALIKNQKAIFTIEEHSITGGLGSAVAEYLAESDYIGLFKRIALPDEYTDSIGHRQFLLESQGFSLHKILELILSKVSLLK